MIELVHGRNGWLVLTFGFYVVFLFIFAEIYQRIYRRRPSTFSFNRDISQSQDQLYRARKAQEATRLTAMVSVLTVMQEELRKGPVEFVPEYHAEGDGCLLRSQSGYEARLVRCYETFPEIPFWRELTVLDPSGSALILNKDVGGYRVPDNASDFQMTLSEIATDFNQTVSAVLNIASAPVASPEMWSYLDFLYFSTITQSTVGYGDILPNSTTVRMFVVAQIVVGYALLVVILNLVFAASH